MSMRQVKKTRIKLAFISCGNIAHFHIKAFKKYKILNYHLIILTNFVCA